MIISKISGLRSQAALSSPQDSAAVRQAGQRGRENTASQGPGRGLIVGRNQRWELNVALCAGCFDSGASMGLLDWMTRLTALCT